MFLIYIGVEILDSFYDWTGCAGNLSHGTHPSMNACVRYLFIPRRSASCTCNFLLLMKVLLLIEKEQGREYNVCLYLFSLPSVLSPLRLGWLNRLKLDWCHCTPPQVKGSAELSHSAKGHQKKPQCCLSCGWAGMWVHTLPKEDMRSRPQCTDSIVQTEQECNFSCLFLEKKKSFPGEHRNNNFSTWRLQLWPVLAEARLFLPASSTPLGKADPHGLLEFYFGVHLLWEQTKQCFWLNQSWSPSVDLCHSAVASFRITPRIVISLQLSSGMNLNLGVGLAGWASELHFLSFLTDLWRVLNSCLLEKSQL